LAGSPILATPLIIEKSTKGMAISFSNFIKIIPKGSIKLIVKELQPMKLESKAQMIPRIIPIIIFQWSASFFFIIGR
jgi:hypothetical protein